MCFFPFGVKVNRCCDFTIFARTIHHTEVNSVQSFAKFVSFVVRSFRLSFVDIYISDQQLRFPIASARWLNSNNIWKRTVSLEPTNKCSFAPNLQIITIIIICSTAFAKYPIIALFTISYVILGLCYGITYLSVTSDPIEIWAAPTSRARIEKDYFDSRFQPFYRTEQVYIKSVGLDKVKLILPRSLLIRCTYVSE